MFRAVKNRVLDVGKWLATPPPLTETLTEAVVDDSRRFSDQLCKLQNALIGAKGTRADMSVGAAD